MPYHTQNFFLNISLKCFIKDVLLLKGVILKFDISFSVSTKRKLPFSLHFIVNDSGITEAFPCH
jgi:hypothetical protein